ncbi:MAG: chorismate synthase [Proteobacteria bacterium]|nr:chorismate synthase [Pseudomonadota bacterium]
MSANTFGHLFRFTTFGESHGPAIGCVVDGTPPGIALSEADIQVHMDKRRPGQSKYTTQRKESDTVRILSGVYDGVTTGTSIGLLVENEDTRSKDYDDIKDKYRPGHADYTYDKKYGIRDYRGGGRSSARETAMRVAAGAIARKILGDGVTIRGAMVRIGDIAINRDNWDWDEINNNPFFSPDRDSVKPFEDLLDKTRKDGSSIGAVIEVIASGVPAGLGAPIYAKLDADLAGALMGIPAVKGVEIGAGFEAARLSGEQNADEMRMDGDTVRFLSNNAGGILGGISTGQDIVSSFAVKPTSSILKAKRTVNTAGNDAEVLTKGRHDPCVGIRAIPIGEAMVACVLADHMLRHRAQCG